MLIITKGYFAWRPEWGTSSTLCWTEENVEVLEEPICLRVHILSSEEEFIDIRLREDRYIRSIVEEIGAKNSIDVIYDWALFLQVEGGTIRMPPDEKILAFTAKWKVEITSG